MTAPSIRGCRGSHGFLDPTGWPTRVSPRALVAAARSADARPPAVVLIDGESKTILRD
jgi:hypothetical protein